MNTSKGNNRRNFLKSSAVLLSTAFFSGTLLETCNTENKNDDELVKVLTPDGKLISIPKNQIAEHKSHITNAEARIGIPGKKFVMVIDLAKCDGCGKCTEACQKMHFVPPTKEWLESL